MDLGITGRVAIVSGASAGMGQAIAAELAREGAKVMLVSRRVQPLKEAAECLAAAGGTVAWHSADMSKQHDVVSAVDATRKRFGDPDIAIANVSPTNTFNFATTSDEDFLRVYNELVMSTVYLARAVLPSMAARRWGRLVNIGSICMKEPHRFYNTYLSNTGRAAVVGLNRTFANEFAPLNITVNTIAPGQIATGRLGRQHESAMMDGIELVEQPPRILSGREGRPEEIGAVCAFLCSEQAAYITGQTIAVDGGWSRTL